MNYLYHYLLAAIVFVAIDSIWIGVVANKFYKANMGKLLLDKPKLLPAVIFYALYIGALLYLAVEPALTAASWSQLLGRAAVLGLVMYATYDLTNLATLKQWPAKVVVVDMIWGTFITAVVAAIVFVIFR